MLSRRSLMTRGAAVVASAALAACATTDPTTGVTSYGLPASVIAYIQNIVAQIKAYIPTVESIAGTALSLFGPSYASIVAIGTAAIDTVISALTNLITPPVTASLRYGFRRRGRYGRVFVGWTSAQHVPIYAQVASTSSTRLTPSRSCSQRPLIHGRGGRRSFPIGRAGSFRHLSAQPLSAIVILNCRTVICSALPIARKHR